MLEEDLANPTLPDLVSGPEAAEILGVTPQRVLTLAAGNSRFPKPAYTFRTGRVRYRAAVEKFAAERDRKPGRPRTREALLEQVEREREMLQGVTPTGGDERSRDERRAELLAWADRVLGGLESDRAAGANGGRH